MRVIWFLEFTLSDHALSSPSAWNYSTLRGATTLPRVPRQVVPHDEMDFVLSWRELQYVDVIHSLGLNDRTVEFMDHATEPQGGG